MSERFYFDLTNAHSTVRDMEGVLASGIDEAVVEARAALREIHEHDELSAFEEGWVLIIRDAAGDALTKLPIVSRLP